MHGVFSISHLEFRIWDVQSVHIFWYGVSVSSKRKWAMNEKVRVRGGQRG